MSLLHTACTTIFVRERDMWTKTEEREGGSEDARSVLPEGGTSRDGSLRQQFTMHSFMLRGLPTCISVPGKLYYRQPCFLLPYPPLLATSLSRRSLHEDKWKRRRLLLAHSDLSSKYFLRVLCYKKKAKWPREMILLAKMRYLPTFSVVVKYWLKVKYWFF